MGKEGRALMALIEVLGLKIEEWNECLSSNQVRSRWRGSPAGGACALSVNLHFKKANNSSYNDFSSEAN